MDFSYTSRIIFCEGVEEDSFSFRIKTGLTVFDIEELEGKEIVIKAITSSIIRDMASGNGIDIAVVKKEGPAEKEFISIKE